MELNCMTAFIKHDLNYNVKHCFKTRKPFDNRKEEVMAIRSKFPNKIPLIVEKYHKEKNLPGLDKTKFLVPQEITMSQFLVIIRNRMKVKPNQALYLIINNRSMLSMSLTMAQAYEYYSDEDGFLYVTYASQEVFGYQSESNTDGDTRRPEVIAVRNRFPNKVPVIVERFKKEKSLPELNKKKFLVPQEITISQFLYVIRNKMQIKNTQALYLIINNRSLACNSMTMAEIYEMHRNEDGFLYIMYATQEVFG